MSDIDLDHQFDEMLSRLRGQDYARYLTVKMAPTSLQAPLLAIHIFYQEIADVPRVAHEPMMGQVRLLWWRDSLTQLMQGQITGNPQADNLKEPLERFGAPLQQALLAVIEGVAFELEEGGITNQTQLHEMMVKRYGGLLRACLIVAGVSDQVQGDIFENCAFAIGISELAAGLIRSSVTQAPLYPADLLKAYGLSDEAFFHAENGAKFGALLDELARLSGLDKPCIKDKTAKLNEHVKGQLAHWSIAPALFKKAKKARYKGSTEIIKLNPLAIYWHMMRALH